MKKFKISIITMFIVLFGLTNIYASEGIIDIEYSDSVYKLSESNIIDLPFLRVSAEKITMDKDVNKSGISLAKNMIEVTNNLKGIQTLMSSDTVRISGNMEYGLIMAPTVIIDGSIDKTLVIVANNVTITEKATIKEDLILSCDKLDMKGIIEGNLLGSSTNVNISGKILKDFRINSSNIVLSENSEIKEDIYIETYNNDINIKNRYPNATVKVLEKVDTNNYIDIWGIIRTSLLFSLIYLLLSLKTNVIKNAVEKVKTFRIFTVASGIVSILLIPLIFALVVFMIFIGLGIVVMPITLLYFTFMIISFSLSSLILGSVMCEYVANKYENKLQNFWSKLIMSFIIFAMIMFVPYVPYIGYTVSLTLCMISAGTLLTILVKKIK